MGIKRDKYDAVFSDCVRQAAMWTCQRCGIVDADGQASGKSWRTHCSHIMGRRHKSVRWYPDNCICLCAGCHLTLGDNPIEHAYFARKYLGDTRFDALMILGNSTYKWTKHDKEAMYVHYKQELKRLKAFGMDTELVSYQ